MGGRAYVRNLACPNERYVELAFTKRGWSGDNAYGVTGQVFSAPNHVAYKIEGKWNQEVRLLNASTGNLEYTWKKPPYPDNWEYMYGMTRHHLQFNILNAALKDKIAPTDCRLRPDQRALENGDFKLAAAEKHRLEEKQRAVRRYNEKNKIEPKPFYFEAYENPDDTSQLYYRYNGKYWE